VLYVVFAGKFFNQWVLSLSLSLSLDSNRMRCVRANSALTNPRGRTVRACRGGDPAQEMLLPFATERPVGTTPKL
jgi:hypothetical protein